MKQRILYYPLLLILIAFLFSGCEVVGGIFKAGMWFAFIIVGIILALIIYFVSKARRK